MTQPTSQLECLRKLQRDMQEMYEAAKLAENAAQCERLAKSIATLTKQIKDQEIHEREVIPRAEAIRFAQVVATTYAKWAKEQFGESAIEGLTELSLQLELVAEAELS